MEKVLFLVHVRVHAADNGSVEWAPARFYQWLGLGRGPIRHGIVVVVPPDRVGLGDVQDDSVGFARARVLVHDPGAVIGNFIGDIQRLQVSGVRHREGLDKLRRKHELGVSRAREKLLVGNESTKHACSDCARCDLVSLPGRAR